MPKKHKSSYSTSSSYVHPSLSSSKPPAAVSPPATVNEKLSQLRQSYPSAELAQRQQREIAQGSAQRSVPPELRSILGVPEVAPPRPRPGIRLPRSIARFRTPGPAPPPSWLTPKRQAALDGAYDYADGNDGGAFDRARPRRLGGFLEEVGHPRIDSRSLTHIALRTIVLAWEHVDDDGLLYLAHGPAYLRVALLSYLATLGPPSGISAQQLGCLLLETADGLSCLDLSGLAGWTLTMRELINIITHYNSSARPSTDSVQADPADSWDDEDTLPSSFARQSPPLQSRPPITALSLAYPPPDVSWTNLLSLASQLPTLTTLSLAHWPWPTKTPHLAGATYTGRDSRTIPASGSSYYAALDSDLVEARSLLRQLSRSTYCLRQLDVSGCTWTAALAPGHTESSGVSPSSSTDFLVPPTETPSATGPDWAGAWKLLSTLRLAQALAPSELDWVPSLPSSTASPRPIPTPGQPTSLSVHADVLHHLHTTRPIPAFVDAKGAWYRSVRTCSSCGATPSPSHSSAGPATTARRGGIPVQHVACGSCDVVAQVQSARFEAWLAREVELRRVAGAVIRARGAGRGRLVVDYGWWTSGSEA